MPRRSMTVRTLAPRTPGRTLEQNLDVGTVNATDPFGRLEAGNTALTWGLRVVGWLMMFLVMFMGFSLIFRPRVAVSDLVRRMGSLGRRRRGRRARLRARPRPDPAARRRARTGARTPDHVVRGEPYDGSAYARQRELARDLREPAALD